jgi:hypothetical protein
MTVIHPAVESARKLLADLKKIPIPKGETLDQLGLGDNKLPGSPFLALAGFIENHQDPAMTTANSELLDRLRGVDETDANSLPKLLIELALSQPDDANLRILRIRNALTLKSQGLFEALHSAIKSIARDKDIELGHIEEETLGEKPKPKPSDASDRARDAGTWRESLHGAANTSDELDAIIRNEAKKFDADRPSDDYISQIANADIAAWKPPPPETEYEKDEELGHYGYINEKYRLETEIKEYAKLAATVETLIKKHLGAQLDLKKNSAKRG